ncbi:MAG TPA: hypothetical protein VIX86_20015 [Streptosporangiaceae bacterium]
MPQHKSPWRTAGQLAAIRARAAVVAGITVTAVAVPGAALAVSGAAPAAAVASDHGNGCHLGNGVKHVVEIVFDNVHFFRDNPNVPSDLELMPHLLHFIQGNGTLLSNNHTPLIAHTAVDSLTTYTGLYGDRQGMPISNDYQAYNTDGTTDSAGSFAYWTDPVFDTASTPSPGHDTNPSMVYSPVPPATASQPVSPTTVTPAPWVPFTRAGCNFGAAASANLDLENTGVDIPKVFGANSPEVQQLAKDPDSFKDAETADYVGVAVHCAQGSAFCATAQGVKYGQSSPTPTAVPDVLTDEPGGYQGFQALFGHRYIAPQLGAGTPSLSRNGYEVTNAAGNLVDLNGNQLNGAFLSNHPGFPGFGGINASQTLAYLADMQESGVPVTYGYIADIHGNEHITPDAADPGLASCKGAPSALGSGTSCYIAQAQYYDAAFQAFFNRLAADGITPHNTLFVISSDEGDHEAGANVGRAIQPTPANCDGVTTPCTYPSGSFGELAGNLTGLLATQKNDTTSFSLENDTAPEFYVTGQPSANAPQVRTLEHDVAGLTAANPYTGTTQPITNYLADPVEEGILHMVNADPARTPTFALFAKPDYYLSTGTTSCGGPCVTQNSGFAYDHGDYAAEINTNYLGIVGPGVANLGLDGTAAGAGPNSAGANSGQITVPGSGTTGTWMDETDIRPTLLYLAGLKDDYIHDGRVITEILTHPNHALADPAVTALGACYKQLNSSVGDFGTATLQAATSAIESTSPGDFVYRSTDQRLSALERIRDHLANRIKDELNQAEFSGVPVFGATGQTFACKALIGAAEHLAAH